MINLFFETMIKEVIQVVLLCQVLMRYWPSFIKIQGLGRDIKIIVGQFLTVDLVSEELKIQYLIICMVLMVPDKNNKSKTISRLQVSMNKKNKVGSHY